MRCRFAIPIRSILPGAAVSGSRAPTQPVDGKSERNVAGVQRRGRRSSDLPDVDEIVGEDPTGLDEKDRAVPVVRNRLDEIEVRGHAPHADRTSKVPPDTLLEDRSPPLGDVPQERLPPGTRGTTFPSTEIGRQAAISGGRWVLADVGDDLGQRSRPTARRSADGRPSARLPSPDAVRFTRLKAIDSLDGGPASAATGPDIGCSDEPVAS
jgi:hypothetical protein